MEKSLELEPNRKNLLYTYEINSIGRNDDVNKFVNLLDAIKGNCVIALNGKWGTGKTFFIKQVSNIINSFNDNIDNKDSESYKREFIKNNPELIQKQNVIYYDAWEHDDEEDPLLSLLCSIVNQYKTKSKYNIEIDNILVEIMKFFTGKDVLSLIDSIKNNKKNIVTERIELKIKINELLQSIRAEKTDRTVIIIDELDRCCPSFAIKMLERVKHFFNDDLLTFVFSVNLYELQNTIKTYYGNGFNAIEYLNRFFDFCIEIPELNIDKFINHISNDKIIGDNIKNQIIKFGLSMREIMKFIRVLNIAISPNINRSSYLTNESTMYLNMHIIPLMILLKMKDIDSYSKFVKGENPKPFIDIMYDYGYDSSWENKVILGMNEVFHKKNNQNSTVKLIDKTKRLKEVYEAYFINNGEYYHEKVIGQLVINNDDKNTAISIANLLSNITNLLLL